jgi:hypothetical protein
MAVLSSGTYTYVLINFTGGTNCAACSSSLQPHPSYGSLGSTADTVVQLNAITLGGFNGLNN